MSPTSNPGRVITFYSYKGGTGRTMLLSNVAWVLASNGHRVLVIDWDLEAPGLHRFYHPFLVDKEMTSTPGVIDLVTDYLAEAMSDKGEGTDQRGHARWYEPLTDITRYAVSIDYPFETGGKIDLVPAGRQGPTYPIRVNSFNWQVFYGRLEGASFLLDLRRRMQEKYDYVLIDSRTGVSDTSGICTVEMPDVLAVCFTMNTQSIEGASAVATSVREQRPAKQLRILPIPTRIELAEREKLEIARDYAHQKFRNVLPDDLDVAYWLDVEVVYTPYYAYEEILSPFADRPRDPSSVLSAIERITARLTDGKVTTLKALGESERAEIRSKYLRQRRRETETIARLKDEVSEKESQVRTATRRSRQSRVFASLAGLVTIVAVVASIFVSRSGGSNTPDETTSKAAIVGILAQETQLFQQQDWPNLYVLFSPDFKAGCDISTFTTNYSAFWSHLSGQLEFQGVAVQVDGSSATATYTLVLGGGSSSTQVGSDNPDRFVFTDGQWLDDADSVTPCDPLA